MSSTHATAGLPDLVIVGAPRCGTTTLASWLSAHPSMAGSHRKECSFFDRHWDRGLTWYQQQFPTVSAGTRRFEATPTYLSEPEVPARVAGVLPRARFLVVVRDPVMRAWSQYWYFVQLGVERRSWRQAIDQELAGRMDYAGYLRRGRYGEQLDAWQAAVGPGRTLVVTFDELLNDPIRLFSNVCTFVGVDSAHPPADTSSVNPTRQPKSARLQRGLVAARIGRWPRNVGYRIAAWNGNGPAVPYLDPAEATELRALFESDNAVLARHLQERATATATSEDRNGTVADAGAGND